MWTFDAFPAETVQRRLGVQVGQDWLDHVRAGSVRLTSGCSGALVSRRGLVVTNEHCMLACAQTLSDRAHDRLTEGFGIGAAEPPRPCPGVQAEVLVAITDVTDAMAKASAGKTGDEFVKARQDWLATAERRACGGDRRYRCQVISFFGGGQFKLYKYRRYSDVRLVFAPEFAVAFSGDRDNFHFPRYDLDVAVLRLYEHGAPAAPRAWLAWSDRAPAEGEAVFVSGSPGTTHRGLSVSQLESLRDVANPELEAAAIAFRERLRAYAAQGPRQAQAAADRLFDVENALKLITGENRALADAAFFADRRADETALRASLAFDPKLGQAVGDPWGELQRVRRAYAAKFQLWRQLESGAGSTSRLYWYARTLVRAAAERPRPAPERLPEFSDARLALMEKSLFDPQPIDPGLEAVCLQAWLEEARARLGPADPVVTALLDGEAPEALAARLASGSRLADPAFRAALWKGGEAAVEASADPLIAFVRRTDPMARAARQVWEEEVLAPSEDAASRLALARLSVRGAAVYPDATYSPRISFGRVEGWKEKGALIAPFTTLGGLYDHAEATDPARLSARWRQARRSLDPGAVLDFVATTDIVGGSSGSPVVDTQGAVVGEAFDGNQASLAADFAYDGASDRTVVVSSGAIDQALAKVYGRSDLVRELHDR